MAWPGGSLTYGELNARANQLARHLRGLGVGPEIPVGILARRSPEMLIGILGTLKAGGCYLPLDPAYPEERLAETLADAGARLLLSASGLATPRIAASVPAVFRLDEDWGRLSGLSEENVLETLAGLDNLAYVIYTSGSTGKPKGVEVEHRGLSNLVSWHCRTYEVTPEDRATRLAGSAFDASVWEVWPYLAAGASLHIPPDELLLSPPDLVDYLVRERITVCFLPTPLAEAVLEEAWPSEAPLRAVLTGGDRLHRAPSRDHPFRFYNHYGPTENSVVSTVFPVPPGERASRPPIGRPIDGVEARLEEGELWIGGVGLARGYRGRPDLTAERFVPHPSSSEPGARMYRTGDLVQELPSGDLDFVGRIDFQVKVRGFRIELGEIEVSLLRHPNVKEGVVEARDDGRGGRGGKRLVAYVVPRGPFHAEELAEFLGRTLPEYMVPTAWVELASLPLNPSGKVDRRALPEPERDGESYVAPRTAREETLAAIFAEVLGLTRVSIEESFFGLGGHSLQATQVVSRVRSRLGLELAPGVLFENPTVSSLSAVMTSGGEGIEDLAIQPLDRVGEEYELPASYVQQGLWLSERWSAEPALYNTPFALDLAGSLDVSALARAIQEIVDRHEPLRGRFREVDGQPVLVVRRRLAVPLPVLDLSALPVDRAAGEAERLSAEEARRPFDLARGPLLRTLLIRRSATEHGLLLLMHHIVSDDWSITVMLRELTALYQGSLLPPLPVQYGDFAAWQRRWLTGPVLERQLGWWRETLRPPLPVLDLPADRPRPARRSFRGARLRTLIPRERIEALAAVGQRGEAWLFMSLLAAFDVLLYRYTGNPDVLVGAPIANRNRVELEGLAGFFVNTLALRSEVNGEAGFLDLLARVRRMLLGAYEHQDLPFERLVEELAPERDLSRSPLLDVFFILGNALRLPERLGPELALEVRELEAGVAKVDLSLFLDDRAEGLALVWEYATDLFDPATVARMAGHLEILMAGLAAEPERPVLDLPLLSPAERAQLADWNATREPRPAGATLHGLFRAQAARTPEALAVLADGGALTYRELDERSDRLAGRLLELGAGVESRVGLLLERSLEMVVALLGVLKAGGAYVPLDPEYPAERLAAMAADAGTVAVLRPEDLAGLPPSGAPLPLLPEVPDLAVAYLIFTSGSTGRPKGTMVPHRAIVNHMLWMQTEFPLEPGDRVLQKTSFSFDASVWEFWAPLLAGATLVMARPGEQRDPASLIQTLQEREATVIQAVPSLLRALLEDGRFGECRTLRRVFCGGEALTADVQTAFFQTMEAELVNLYGPTETTVEVTSWRCVPERADQPALLGRPILNASLHVCGPRLEPSPIGVPGELYVGGTPVSRGYHGRPEETAARFLPDPFTDEPGGRLYRTGDLVRYRPGGELEYLGRIDHQVKIRGFRVELGEVETALSRLPGVEAATVLARDGSLAAYVVPRQDLVTAGALREGLRERLPDYMVPTAFVFLDALPLTPNGKVDRRALARLAAEPEAEEGYVAPRNPVEEMVAALFAEVLGLERVGVHDDFFALGGHSLLATRVISRLRGAFAVEPEMRVVFERSTVEALAAWVVLARRKDVPQAPPILPRDSEAPAPLSFAQERLWFLHQLEPESIAYNLPMIFRIGGPLMPAALEAALAEAERRHQVLRTVFADGVQAVLPPGRKLPLVDLSGVPAEEAERLAREEARRPFDLEKGPVLRTTLLRLSPDEHRLLLTLDHAASDAWSLEILVRELGALYSGVSLPEPRLQYADFAVWQRGWLSGDVLASELSHWRERLAGAPLVLELPTDFPRPPVQSHRGGVEWVRIDAGLTEEIRRLARRFAATPFMVLLGAFQALMGRYARQEELLVGTPVAGRTRGETEELIGLFVNTLVLRGDLTGDPTFADLLARLREVSLDAYAHQDLPFETLVEGLAPERDLSRSPVFQVLFGLQNTAPLAPELAPGLSLKVEEGLTEQAKFDLKLMLDDDGISLTGGWEFCADLFEAATIRRLAGHFTKLLSGLVTDPQARLWEIAFLGEEERRQVVLQGIPPGPDGGLIHERFERWAARTPEAPALAFEGAVLTFRELDEQANRLARRLRRLGVGPETSVGVRLERSLGMVVAILGVLKAGGAYVPLDPEFPEDRLAFMLEDSGAQVLVKEEFLESVAGESAAPLEPLARPEHLAYVIYTSGSTGRPKGVMVEHRQLSSYVDGVVARMALPEGSSYATVSTIAADLGNTVVFASLATGGLLHVISRDRLGDSLRLAEYFDQHPIDALKIVPSHLAALERVAPRRLLVTGGEALPWSLADRMQCPVLNHYGPTETTVGVLAFPVEPDADRRGPTVPLGRPLGGTRVVVVDGRLQPVPVGVPGELLAGGPQVTRGYLGRPDLTAERFVPDPFGGGERLYRTGDLARLLPGGDVEFLGRIDHQVKIRGFRVEPGEIEAALRSHPDVREALVLARPLPTGENRLVAYVVPRDPADTVTGGLAAELRRRSRETLPEALVPSAFVLLEAIPLTPNGKVDRRALPEPEALSAGLAAVETGSLAALSPIEAVVAGAFAQLLALGRVEADDDFFALGGHSLLAMRVLALLRKAFDADLDLKTIFEGRTVAGLARLIEERLERRILADAPPLAPQGRFGEGMPLSFAQESLWFLDRLEPGSIAYNVPRVMRLWGELSVPALAAALGGMVLRHEVLRTIYGEAQGEPRQRVLPFGGLALPVVDLEALPEPLRHAERQRIAEQEGRRPIDLTAGPTLRALLLRVAPVEHALLILTHHIASDGWSVGVIVRELSALYAGQSLPPLPLQYGDFAAWQRSWLSGSTLDTQIDWWRHELAGGTGGDTLPADRPRPRVPTSRGAVERFSLPPSLAAELERLGQRSGATLFMTLLAAFQALLHRYTGEEDVRVGTSVSGRGRAEVADLIGFFVNTLVLRGDLSGRPSFTELLARMRESALGAYAHQDLPFVKLVEALAPERSDRGRAANSPLFQALFALERPAAAPVFELGPSLSASLEEPPPSTAKFDLTVVVEPAGEALAGSAEYSADLFDAATVRRMLGHFETLLAGLAADPNGPISEIPLLGEEERRQLIADWNGTETEESPAVERQIARWATLSPNAPAILADGRSWTHAELEARTAALARHLRHRGVGPETVVGVLLDRSPEAVATLLGVLRAGGAYLPLDPAYPSERLAYMLSDSGASLLVTRRSLWPALPSAGVPVVELESVGWENHGGLAEDGADPANLAYVLYTSGSTGRPKGVGVPRAALASRTATMARLYELVPGDRVLQFASLSFDVAAEEIFPTLASGSSLVLIADPRQMAAADLGALVAREKITVLNLPSPVWHEWVDNLPATLPPSLRLVVVGSDAVSAERLAHWRKTGIPTFNAYGLTETTVTATAQRIENEAGSRVPIGQPVAGARAYVVDPHGQPVPLLVPGELWIGGAGLARGYLGRPDLTAERFLPDSFTSEPGARLYRTGDLVRRRGDGALEFLGRIDSQMKVRGFRIEPGEVEAALASQPAVAQAAVGVREDRLVAYVVPRDGQTPDTAAIREFLEARLSPYMVPSRFAFLEALPLTPSGKVDRRALAQAPLPEPVEAREAGPEPRTPTEALLSELFADLLGVEQVEAEDNFFHLGGHSLLASRLVAQVREAFEVDLPLRVVFDTPTVAALSRWIEGARGVVEEVHTPEITEPELPRETGPRTLPASFAQQRLWLLDRLQNGASAMYNMPSELRIHGPLRPAALEQALDEIVRRHEVLRTVFEVEDGHPVQTVQPFAPAGLPVVDLSALPEPWRLDETARRAAEWSRRPFDLERGPVFRASLLRLGSSEHMLLLNIHHIASDGWSNGVLVQELSDLYQAFAAGRPSPLPELPMQYGDYAAWQRRWLSGDVLEEQLAFWRDRLGTDPEPLELPADRPRPAVQSGRGAVARRTLPASFGARLERLARHRGATAFMAFLAAFQTLLHRYTGREDVTVGTPVANRDRLEVEGLIGCFVNTLALRTDLSGDPPFLDLLGRVQETALSAFVHQELPFERLVEELVSGRDLSRTPITQVAFTLQQETAAVPAFGPELRVELERSHHDTAKFDLALFFGRFEREAEVMAEYSTDLFEAATVERLLGHLGVLIEGIEEHPEARLSELPLLSAAERAQLTAWNEETRRERPEELVGSTLHGLFEAQARRTPDAIALIVGEERLSYAALEERSEALARSLRGLGVGPEVGVGIFLNRTAELVVALLATLKAGGFYVPLDPAYPAERVGFMLEDSRCAVVLTSTDLHGRLHGQARTVLLDEEVPAGPALPRSTAGSGNLAYLIYTSGSTGRPKAVAIEHRSAVAMVLWSRREFSDLELSGVLGSTSITFDMSVFEIFAPLAWGGTVILAENALALPQLPARNEVRVIDTVPSAMAELIRMGGVPSSVVTVNLGGEPIPRVLADQVYGVPGIERLYNVYGPSEDTTFSTWALIERESERGISIGRPLDGEQAWIVDAHLNPTPIGIPGELYLGGEGVSRGYFGRPDLTAERFVPDPFSGVRGVPGSRMYRVGDLVRYRPDGEMEYLGRIDHQVKIRGFRVELGEVEEALRRLPGVEAAVVLAREGSLAAYVVPRLETATLREGLRQRLPEYMVPTAFVFLDALPLTPNGKVDRRALAKISVEAEALAEEEYVAPRGPVEEAVAEAAAGLLGLERIGREDDFFLLGGHSLLAARLVARIRELFGVDLSLRAVFETPTVEGLARRIEEGRGSASSRQAPPLLAHAHREVAPPSFAQQRLWLLDRLRQGSAAYNMPSVFRVRGPLRPEVLGTALNEIVRRHEVLRTVFGMEDGQPVQIVRPFEPQPLAVVDLAVGSDTGRLIRDWSLEPFDLERGPVFRAALLRLSGDEHLLLLNVHHVASDGWSNGILVRELGALYQAFAAGLPSPLPPLPIQYADYAVWQRDWLKGEVLEEQLAFWRSRLGMDPEPLELPTDRPRPAVQSGRGAAVRHSFPAGLGDRLERLSQAAGATPFMAFLAAFQTLLHRYTGRQDLSVGTPVANRDHLSSEGLIGCFVNTLVLRTDLSGDPPFLALLERVRDTALSAFQHQDLPFERLVEELVPTRDLSRAPLAQVVFVLQQEADAVLSFGPELRVEPEAGHGDTAKFDLTLFAGRSTPRGHRMELLAEYSTDLFEATTIQRWLGHLGVLIAGIEQNPQVRLSELPLLSAAERDQLAAWNEETRRERPEELVESTLHSLFEAQTRRTPDAIALVVGEERLSYAALEERSEALARSLRGLGVGPEVGVGIFLPRNTELVVALLATLKAGGFYVPLDPAYPAERVGFMLEDSRCAVVLTNTDLHGRVHGRARTVLLDEALPAAPAAPGTPAGSGNLAYLIYTSGSTGRPKAVAIEHRSAVAMVLWSRREFSDLELSGVLGSTSITFDMSVFEIFAPLAWGGTVILAENALALPQLPARNEVRVIDTVPSAMAELIRMGGVPSSVVTVNLGGEPIPRVLADQVYGVPEIERLYNVYGPSEDTTFSTWALIERESERGISIGRPLDGEQAWIVDAHLNPTPIGIPGELYLGGEGVSRGYFGRPDLTAERFVPDPFSEIPGSRMYRVGDLVRYRPDGEMEFLGRIDHQVKIRGFRVELGEVEEALRRLPGVEAAVVLAREGSLAAYVVPRLETAVLRDGLRQRLPEYMVPTAFVFLDTLPLTPNGKVDRRALAQISVETGQTEGEEYVAPRSPLEELVAGIFANLLGLERVGADSDFFELGGHSLLAARLVGRIREMFGADLSLRAVFEMPTVESLARWIEERSTRGRWQAPPLKAQARRDPADTAPASFAQQRLWFIDRLRRGSDSSAAYNMPSIFRVHGPLRTEVLGEALNEMVRRHEVLRTVFHMEDGQPVQVVQPFTHWTLPVVDLEDGPEAEDLMKEWSLQPFDLERGPVFRALLLRLSDREHLLLLNVHHIASDGWSNGILVQELGAVYQAFAAGLPSPLPPLPIQYADYAVWQRGWLTGEVLEYQLAFWRARLGMDPEPLELPADRPRPAVQSGRGAVERHSLAPGLGQRLERLAQRRGATRFMAYLAAFQTLLHRYTGRTGLSVGTPVANRGHVEIEGLIGCFVNTLVLRTDLSGDPSFPDLLERVRETSLSAFEHQELPFERLVEELVPGRDLSRTPLAQVAFALQQEASAAPAFGSELRVELEVSHSDTAKFDLALFLGRFGDTVSLLAEYSTDLFESVTIRRLLGHLGVLIEGIEAHPEARLSELPLLGEAERAQIVAWNEETRRERPEELVGSTLHGLFEAQARRTPDATALVVGEERLSYAALNARAEELARHLRDLGIGPEVGVGIFLPRDAGLIVALLATLKAGGFYVPLDPAYPAERVGFMLEDSRCAVVLTNTALHGRILGRARTVLLDEEVPAARAVPAVPAGPGNLSYLIYTSGSTGRPKAVAIEHRSAVAMVLWSRREFSDFELSGVLGSTSITFDMSVFEIFAPLAWGGTVILAENALALPHLPARNEVRVVDTVPSAIAELIRMNGVPSSVVTVNLGGEAVPRPLADRVYALPGVERLYNVYGPSEDTTFSTWALIDRSERPPSIGRPLDGEQAWVVDRHLNPTPVGVPGELYLGGEGVSRGYFGRPDLTAERFIPDPFSGVRGVPGSRMYRVGDLVRYRPDGEMEFLGRIDHQVKIRGFRVELGEVEDALGRLPGVQAAVVLAREGSLAAYVVPRVEVSLLREGLRQRLPDYMVPTAFVFLDAMPLTPNGKMDRRALAKLPLEAGPQDGGGFVAPRTPLEEQMAEIWAEVLSVQRVGIHDTFWDLGGHSLLATRVLSRIYESLGVELPLQTLFEYPTVAGLTEAMGQTLLTAGGEEVDRFLAELEGLSEDELQELLRQESL